MLLIGYFPLQVAGYSIFVCRKECIENNEMTYHPRLELKKKKYHIKRV